MEEKIHKLRLASYKAQLEVFRLERESLAQRFERQGLSGKERDEIGRRLTEVVASTNAYQFLVELMEWHDKKAATQS